MDFSPIPISSIRTKFISFEQITHVTNQYENLKKIQNNLLTVIFDSDLLLPNYSYVGYVSNFDGWSNEHAR